MSKLALLEKGWRSKAGLEAANNLNLKKEIYWLFTGKH